MTKDDQDYVADLEVCEKATPGPWKAKEKYAELHKKYAGKLDASMTVRPRSAGKVNSALIFA